MNAITLTDDQAAAYRAFVSFIIDPTQNRFVLTGYAGTGKSTLVNKLLQDLDATLKTAQLIGETDIDWTIALTATTNKACEALSEITGHEVRTIQSFIGLRVETDYKAKTTKLVAHGGTQVHKHYILFIDEASYADKQLLDFINRFTEQCKIIYIGDPAQLTPINSSIAPVFTRGYKTAALTEVVRQAEGNPIIGLATDFRNVVNGAPWSKPTLDQNHVIHLPRDKFTKAMMAEFDRPDWHHYDSKVLAYRNAQVIDFNKQIRDTVQGAPELQVGDFAVCNKYIATGKWQIKTDQTVQITEISRATKLGVDGWNIMMDGTMEAFMPRSLDEKNARLKEVEKAKEYNLAREIKERWIDLRAIYACTINKSQGSTYDRVFIDLDDISRCHSGNQMARMMYVAVSRARHQVYLTGDLA